MTDQDASKILRCRWILFLLLILMLQPWPHVANAYNLEKHLGLYEVVKTQCELTKGLFNPCPGIKYMELVKGRFYGVEPDEVAFVIWKVDENDPIAAYEAELVMHHKNLPLEDNKIWLAGTKDSSHQRYFTLKGENIIQYRFLLTQTNKAGDVFKRDFNYHLTPVSRADINKVRLSYPDAFPAHEEDQETYLNSSDSIYKKAVIDENLSSDFFNSKKASLKWHVIKDEHGRFEDTLDGHVSKEDKIPLEHTSNCISTHQGRHEMHFCDASLRSGVLRLEIHGGLPAYNSSLLIEVKKGGWFSCFFKAGYPAPSSSLKWKILSKELQLKTLEFKSGESIFGRLEVEFEETAVFKGEKTVKKYKIKGFIKPVIEK